VFYILKHNSPKWGAERPALPSLPLSGFAGVGFLGRFIFVGSIPSLGL